jgi:hypothetical protein
LHLNCLYDDPYNTTTVAANKNGPADTCLNQAACLSVYFNSSSCTTTSESGSGAVYTYCRVCLFWGDDRNCPKDSTKDTISHVCSGDQFLPVIPGSGGAPVQGNTSKLQSWSGGVQGEMLRCGNVSVYSRLQVWSMDGGWRRPYSGRYKDRLLKGLGM